MYHADSLAANGWAPRILPTAETVREPESPLGSVEIQVQHTIPTDINLIAASVGSILRFFARWFRCRNNHAFRGPEVEGAKLPDAMLNGSKIIIKGDAFTSISGGITYEGTIKIDASKTPKTLDLIFTAGPEKGKTAPGISEVGGDNLKICLSLGASGRPTEFAAKQGSGQALETLKREKL